MASIEKAIRHAYNTALKRDWDKIYVACDLHGVVLLPDYENTATTYYPKAKEVMQMLSSRTDVVLIMYTCSKKEELDKYNEMFIKDNIHFDYIGHNPEITETRFGDFTNKLYFNVYFEDKAGFDPDEDWDIVEKVFNQIKPLK